jgi:hypothetical protein
VNGSGYNRYESEINLLKQLDQDLDLDLEKNDIAKQLHCLESRGKKRKLEVDEWLKDLLEIKESVRHMNNLNDTHHDRRSELIQKMKRHTRKRNLSLCQLNMLGGN